jgi:hypothetical protein
VTISGTNFTGATAVEFGTASAQIYTVNSAAGITVVVPNLGAGNTAVAITVTTTVGMAISTSDFSYYASLPDTTTNSVPSSLPAPIISSFTPTSGNTGTAITIQGSNLSGATGVQFGGTNATNFIIDSGSEITAIVGSGSSGSVKVTTPTGVASITGFTFGTVSDNTSGTLTQDNGGVTVLDISDVTDDGGVLQKDFQYGGIPFSGANQIVSLTIAQGTRVISNEGTPVTQMTVQAANDVPPAPTGKTIISAFELGPSGTTFSEPITFLLEYDQNLVPKGTGASGLSLDCYNPQTGQWVKCDYSLDIASHQIKANISHFSLYAVIGSGSSGLMGVGWDLAGIIIISELLVGGVIVYWLLQRKPNKAVIATASVASSLDSSYDTLTGQNVTKGEFVPVSWDDMINQNLKEQNNKGKFKTSVTVMGGKIIIPQQGDLGGIELVNEPNSKIVISLEYDPALSPIGKVTINVLGKESEYEKLKEKRA